MNLERKEYTKVKIGVVKRGWSENILVYLGAITHGQAFLIILGAADLFFPQILLTITKDRDLH